MNKNKKKTPKRLFLAILIASIFFGGVVFVEAKNSQILAITNQEALEAWDASGAGKNTIVNPTANDKDVLPNDTRLHSYPTSNPAPAPTTTEQPQTKHFNYTLLESFPGFFQAKTEMTDLPAMILAIYKFGIWTVGIAGFFMLVVGGFMYMASAGNTSAVGSARKIIADALLGIVAALGAYLILYVINPELTKIKIDFTAVNVEESELGGTLEADKGNQKTSGGCIKPVNEARRRVSWVYSQALRGQTKNGVTYTDCSNFIESSYKAAGCSSPGGTTASMYPNGSVWSSKNDLRAGDAIVRNGHVVLCMDDGCSQVIHSPGTGRPITIKNGSYFTNKSGSWASAKVIKASKYCGGC